MRTLGFAGVILLALLLNTSVSLIMETPGTVQASGGKHERRQRAR
jgi:hypothetical protein